jgi:hypothetical protein
MAGVPRLSKYLARRAENEALMITQRHGSLRGTASALSAGHVSNRSRRSDRPRADAAARRPFFDSVVVDGRVLQGKALRPIPVRT